MRDYIEHLKRKPEHVRRQVALGVSGGVASLVFVGWAAMLVSSGALALNNTPADTSFAKDAKETQAGLAGAAAALSSVLSDGGTVTAVEADVSSTMDDSQDTGEATVIPF
jgi:hypothetical protein